MLLPTSVYTMAGVQDGEVLLRVELQHVLIPLHSAAVRLALLLGNQEVGHTELVVAQLTTEGPKSLDIPVTVGFSNFEELGDEVFGKGDSPQFNLFSIFISEGRFLLTRYGIRTINLSLLFTKSACWKL